MKLDCDVIRDLLPLYCEDIASEKSRELVEEHCRECVECNDKMLRMKQEDMTIEDDGASLKDFLTNVKKNRNAIIALYCYLAFVVVSVIHGKYLVFDPTDIMGIVIIYNFILCPIISFACNMAISSQKVFYKYIAPFVCGLFSMVYQGIILGNAINFELVPFLLGFVPAMAGFITGHSKFKKNDERRFNEGMYAGAIICLFAIIVLFMNPDNGVLICIMTICGGAVYFISWLVKE